VVLVLEELVEDAADALFVVDDQDAGHGWGGERVRECESAREYESTKGSGGAH
jgi:hypothetical protein